MYRHDRRTIEARELRNLVFQGGDRERALPAVEVALDVELEHHPRMIAGPADFKRLNVDEAKLIEVEPPTNASTARTGLSSATYSSRGAGNNKGVHF